MGETCAVRLLGDFSVTIDGGQVPVEAWRHRRGADLVKVLALDPRHRLHREQLMAALWPDLEPEAAGANLRKAVHFARHALGGADAIEAADLVELWPTGGLAVDVEEFEAAARAALTSGTGLEAAAALYSGDLLPADRYADWSEPRREEVRFLSLELWRAAGRWEQVLEIDRADEEAHRELMRAHLAAGNRAAAIRQFQRLREVLRVDLGVGPAEETVALFEQALEADAPEPPSLAERAQAQIARGLLAWNRQDFEAAARIAEDVRALALENELSRELGEASTLLGLVGFAQGRWLERYRAEFERALHLDLGPSAFVLNGYLCMSETMLGSSDCTPMAALGREMLPLARSARSVYGEATASLLIGETAFLAGDLEDSEPWLRAAAGLFEQFGSSSGLVLARLHLALIAHERGRREAAFEMLSGLRAQAAGAELAPHLVVRVFASLVAAAADDDERLATVDEAERTLGRDRICGPCSIGMRINGAIACAHAGELVHARRCLAEAEALAGMWQGGPWRAATWEARGALRLAEGDADQAAALLREAAGLFGECGRVLDQERCAREAAVVGNALGTVPS